MSRDELVACSVRDGMLNPHIEEAVLHIGDTKSVELNKNYLEHAKLVIPEWILLTVK